MTERKLDRVYQLDWRSLDYPVTQHPRMATAAKLPRSYTWSCNAWLDQGQEGACVGVGFTHDLVAKPRVVTGVDMVFARERVYWEAQKIDPWDGGAYPGAAPFYEGTAVLAGAKVLTSMGFYSGYTWGLTLEQMAVGVGYTGPAVIGVDWFEGMFDTDASGFIRPTGAAVGGHCLLTNGVRIVWKSGSARTSFADVDRAKSWFLLRNSWSRAWGVDGSAKISFEDMDLLLHREGDVCFPVRTAKVTV